MWVWLKSICSWRYEPHLKCKGSFEDSQWKCKYPNMKTPDEFRLQSIFQMFSYIYISTACLLTFVWRWTRIAMTLSAENWRFGFSRPYVRSDLIQNIWKTSQVRWKLKIDTWVIIKNVNISNKFIFWYVHRIMNTSGLLQSKREARRASLEVLTMYLRDLKYS